MRLTGTQEWIVIGVLVLYIAFTPGFPVVRQFLSTGIGKAVALGLVVYVWKYVSQPVSILLAINFVRCAGMREGVDETLAENALIPNCPTGFTLNKNTNMCEKPGSTPRSGTVCMPPNTKWNADTGKCGPAEGFTNGGETGSTGPAPPPPVVSGPTGTVPSTPEKKETFYGGFQPNLPGGDSFAPA